jgi:transforming growth factor-beta-induced protein
MSLTIVETAQATPSLSTLVSVLTMSEYTSVLTTLSGAGPFTVFAPNDAAFAKAGIDLTDVATVTSVLQYHVLSNAIMSSALAASQTVVTLQGESVLITKASTGEVYINSASSQVILSDVVASNGIVHIIDTVLVPPSMVPPPTIVETAQATPSLSTLVSVLTLPEYVSILTTLSGAGPFTVFAPNNAAFAKAGIDLTDVAAVTAVLKYHVLSGAVLSSALVASQTVTTLQGESILFTKASTGTISINNGKCYVVLADIVASNGVVHVIESVLLPPSMVPIPTIVKTAQATPSLSTLVSVLTMPQYAPILTTLTGTGPLTVFAPNDAAFAKAGIDLTDVAGVTAVLKYHVLSGAILSSALLASQTVMTLQGKSVLIKKTSTGIVTLNEISKVVAADVVTSNGIVHIIDTVIPFNVPVVASGVPTGLVLGIIAAVIVVMMFAIYMSTRQADGKKVPR